MLNIKKKILLFLFIGYCIISGCGIAAAANNTIQLEKINDMFPSLKTTLPPAVAQTPTTQPQPSDFSNCTKYFNFDSQKLFYLTLAGINANRFKILEIQSKSGYVVFFAAQREFLASIININSQTSMLKITPCNNTYFFPIGIVQNMFKYIELNTNTPIEKLSVL